MKLLVCTQQRYAPNPHSCGVGNIELVTMLRQAIRQAGLDVVVEPTSCMSMCANGPNVRLLPEGKNWHHVDLQKTDEIIRFLQGIA